MPLKQRLDVACADEGPRTDLDATKIAFVDQPVDSRAAKAEHRCDFIDAVGNSIQSIISFVRAGRCSPSEPRCAVTIEHVCVITHIVVGVESGAIEFSLGSGVDSWRFIEIGNMCWHTRRESARQRFMMIAEVVLPVTEERNAYPLARSRAARMLASGLQQIAERDGVSQRQLAKRLGHKQPVMLSHWATGRVPIPVERAFELAGALRLDERGFLLAVLEQRHPTVHWEVLEDEHTPAYDFVSKLQELAGVPVEEFDPGQIRVMREAAADPKAVRRWLSVHEIAVVEMIRRLRPGFHEAGLGHHDQAAVENALMA